MTANQNPEDVKELEILKQQNNIFHHYS